MQNEAEVSQRDGAVALDAAGVAAAIERLADSVASRPSTAELVLIGVYTGGVPLSERLAAALVRRGRAPAAVGKIDITLYRDDVLLGLPQPIVGETELEIDITGRRLILVDDVLFTGRTIRAAIDALIDFGRPRAIELAVLVDRGHRELPIQPDHAGLVLQTRYDEDVEVALTELGAAVDSVSIRSRTL
jgi:pyrimidine operon attenuation protein/uracil phosphoribosyltransferase